MTRYRRIKFVAHFWQRSIVAVQAIRAVPQFGQSAANLLGFSTRTLAGLATSILDRGGSTRGLGSFGFSCRTLSPSLFHARDLHREQRVGAVGLNHEYSHIAHVHSKATVCLIMAPQYHQWHHSTSAL